MLTEELLTNNGFTKRITKKPKIVSATQTSITYCEVFERINGSIKEVITLQVVQKLPCQEGLSLPSHKAPLDVKTSSSPPFTEDCSYHKVVANQKLPPSHNSAELKLVLRSLRNTFARSFLIAISLEEEPTRLDSNLLTILLEAESLLEEIPPSLLEEYLLEAQNYAFFDELVISPLGEREHSPSALFPLSPFNLQEGCS